MAAAAGGDPSPPPPPSADRPTSKSGRPVRPPRPSPPPRPELSKLPCPFQPTFKDVKIHVFDVSKQTNGYVGTLDAVWCRLVRLAPFTVNGTPVTPLLNPKTGFSSHFIIRLMDSTKPKYQVDLLFRDSYMYFVGFRRNLVLTKEEEAEAEKEKQEKDELERKKQDAGSSKKEKRAARQEELRNKKKPGWGQWYRFEEEDMTLPDFFDAKSCGIPAGYGESEIVTIGGPEVFDHMLETLGGFQDGYVSSSQLKIAACRVMVMFSEAVRLRSVWKLVTDRLVEGATPYEIPSEPWLKMRNWTQLGRCALKVRGSLNLSSPLPSWCVKRHKLSTYDDLIGDKGEILLINHERLMMGYDDKELMIFEEQAKTTATGPGSRRDTRF